MVHSLVVAIIMGYDLQAIGQGHIVHVPLVTVADGQALQDAGESHIVHALVEYCLGPLSHTENKL